MADEIFTVARLAEIYDALDPDRGDLEAYAALADELGARSVLDLGCGTGSFALLLAGRGLAVTGVDPAAASLAVARAKPGSDHVCWLHGDASTLPWRQVDLATMTGNVAQAIVEPHHWRSTLDGLRSALRPGGHLVFETRDPAFEAWREWNRTASFHTTQIPNVGAVDSWVEVLDLTGPLITFRWTCVFASDGAVLSSDSTLRFRDADEVEASLEASGYLLDEIRPAPDRPGRELVFVAHRPTG